MGNSPSVNKGSSTGAHVRDVGSSDSERQHDWSKEQLATAKPEEQSLHEELEPYNGAQRAARETRDMPDRNQKKSVRKDENKSPVLQDDSSSSGDERDVTPEEQRRHQPTQRPRPRSPMPQTDSSSSDEEEQQRRASRQRKKTR